MPLPKSYYDERAYEDFGPFGEPRDDFFEPTDLGFVTQPAPAPAVAPAPPAPPAWQPLAQTFTEQWQRAGIDPVMSGVNRAEELAKILANYGITDLSKLGLKDVSYTEYEPESTGYGENVSYTGAMLPVERTGKQLTYGDKAFGYLGGFGSKGQEEFGTQPFGMYEYMQDPNLLAWSAAGKGNVSYRTVQAPNGQVYIVPQWGSSSDWGDFREIAKLAASVAGFAGAGPMLGAQLGLGTGALSQAVGNAIISGIASGKPEGALLGATGSFIAPTVSQGLQSLLPSTGFEIVDNLLKTATKNVGTAAVQSALSGKPFDIDEIVKTSLLQEAGSSLQDLGYIPAKLDANKLTNIAQTAAKAIQGKDLSASELFSFVRDIGSSFGPSKQQIEAEQAEAARRAEAERLAEADRIAEMERQEEQRVAEYRRQEEARRLAEADRVAELERQEQARVAEYERQQAQAREAERQEQARQEALRLEEAQRQENARLEALARAREAERQEAARQEAARQEAARQEAARLEAERQEAARQEAARIEAERQEAARQDAARQEAERAEAERRRAEEAAAEQRRVQAEREAEIRRQEEARLAAEREAEDRRLMEALQPPAAQQVFVTGQAPSRLEDFYIPPPQELPKPVEQLIVTPPPVEPPAPQRYEAIAPLKPAYEEFPIFDGFSLPPQIEELVTTPPVVQPPVQQVEVSGTRQLELPQEYFEPTFSVPSLDERIQTLIETPPAVEAAAPQREEIIGKRLQDQEFVPFDYGIDEAARLPADIVRLIESPPAPQVVEVTGKREPVYDEPLPEFLPELFGGTQEFQRVDISGKKPELQPIDLGFNFIEPGPLIEPPAVLPKELEDLITTPPAVAPSPAPKPAPAPAAKPPTTAKEDDLSWLFALLGMLGGQQEKPEEYKVADVRGVRSPFGSLLEETGSQDDLLRILRG